MGKCKNCNKEIEGNSKRIYCSYNCRNIYVNKNIRDYTKVKETKKKQRKRKTNEYNKNPKKCKYCDNTIPYENKRNDFCNQSCSASFNLKGKKRGKYNLSEDGIKTLRELALNIKGIRWKNAYDKYNKKPKKCIVCDKPFPYNKRHKKFCDNKCRSKYYRKDMDDYKLYKTLTKFKFALNSYPDYFDFSLIEKNGWYKAKNKGDNLGGISRDHIISVRDGFKKMINPLLLSHPANCRLMVHNDNVSKNYKSELTVDELVSNINEFDNKYGRYFDNNLKTYITEEELRNL